jgi:hypothetical protein
MASHSQTDLRRRHEKHFVRCWNVRFASYNPLKAELNDELEAAILICHFLKARNAQISSVQLPPVFLE